MRFSSTAAYCPARPIRERSAVASATASSPATSTRPASGVISVVSMRTTVVFPAPLGPSRPSTVPAGTSKSTPSTARTSPKRFTRPSTRMAGGLSVVMALIIGCV